MFTFNNCHYCRKSGSNISASPPTQTVCSGTAITQIDITNPNNVSGTTFSWTRTNTANLTGIATSGSGSTISGTLTNTTNTQQTTTFTITATAGSCTSSTTVSVIVNPAPTVSATNNNQTRCSGTAIANIVISNPNNVAGTTFSWTRDNTTNLTGIAASGTGTPISGTLTNTTSTQQTTIFTILATSPAGCSSSTTATIVVNPVPTVAATPASQILCSGLTISQIDITNPNNVAGTSFSWTRDNTANLTGIPANGTGSTITGTLVNTTTSPQTTTFTITATAGSCLSSTSVTVIVNPTPIVNDPADQTVCNGGNVNGITFTGTATAYNWVNDNTSIGLAASGTGNIASFTATNPGNTPVTATITVTPLYSNGGLDCSGTPESFTITVNPIPVVTATPTSQTICSETATSIALTSNVSGSTFSWTVTQNGVTGCYFGKWIVNFPDPY